MEQLNHQRITELRVKKGWSQYELAAAAGVTPSLISRLERNLQADFKLSVIIAVAEALGVSVDSLLRHVDDSEWQPEALVPDLQSAFEALSQHPPHIQRQAAGILAGYLSTVE